MSAIRITVARTAGSVPREAGTAMTVSAEATQGTIGGGALEWEAIAEARRMIAEGLARAERTFPLGPALGQCCGGSVTLSFALAEAEARETGRPLWIWGAGHVGRALAAVCAPLPGHAVTLIDDAQERLPGTLAADVTPLVAADMPALVPFAPAHADHLIVTYSHRIDLALCNALLRHRAASIGLIGSATKWARFRGRLAVLGHGPEAIARIACPIGDPSLGKHPQQIAIGVAASLIAGQSGQNSGRMAGQRGEAAS